MNIPNALRRDIYLSRSAIGGMTRQEIAERLHRSISRRARGIGFLLLDIDYEVDLDHDYDLIHFRYRIEVVHPFHAIIEDVAPVALEMFVSNPDNVFDILSQGIHNQMREHEYRHLRGRHHTDAYSFGTISYSTTPSSHTDEAVEKSRKLLFSCLSSLQKKCMKSNGYFFVTGDSGTCYKITKGSQMNVYEIDENGNHLLNHCVVSADNIPVYDHMLAQKLMIETNEDKFLELSIKRNV